MKIKLGLIYGGKSAEHKVSLQTALAVINALDQNKFAIYPIYITDQGKWIRGKQIFGTIADVKLLELESEGQVVSPVSLNAELFPTEENQLHDSIDVIFPLLHGPNGEDGTVQGLFELMNLPYVGNGVLASAAGMDKVVMKQLFAQAGLSQPKYVYFTRSEWTKSTEEIYGKVESEIGYPCFVKPANLGSSVGISKCDDRASLQSACEYALNYDRKIIIEEGISGREIEVGVMGNDEPKCSVAGEIVPKSAFYDYKAKYEDGSTTLVIPAEMPSEAYAKMTELAIKAFKAIDGSGLVRADFFLKENGEVLINEVNTMPGFTPVSMFPLLWKHTGISYPALIEKLVQLAVDRHQEKQMIKYTF